MRILVITQYYEPEKFRINDLISELKMRGHTVTVLTGLPNYPDGKFYDGYGLKSLGSVTKGGINIIRVPIIARGVSSKVKLFLNYLSYVVSATVRALFFKKNQFDVSIVWLTSPVTAALPGIWLRWMHKIPMVVWLQDLWPECLESTGAITKKPILKLVRKLVDFIYRRCDRIFIQSPDFKSHVFESGVAEEKLEFMPNWAEALCVPKPYDYALAKKESMPDGFVVMFAGNIGDAQDFETILAAAKVLSGYSDIHWVFLGKGRRLEWLKRKVIEFELVDNVHILGYRAPELMPNYFSIADTMLAVLKNNGIFSTTIPSKVQSYMASGKPIVAAISGTGAKLINQSGAGFAVEAGDKNGLASAVLKIYEMNKDEREIVGQQARKYYLDHFDQSMLIDRFEHGLWVTVSPTESEQCEY